MDNTEDTQLHDDQARLTSRHSSSYPFLNHSATTFPRNLPPNVDDKLLARQRRRRTSPEDQAILETAYSQDPKPDKAARLEIVKQIALGEKEVQIWFQNRRQTSRRKSRPLLPHELAQYHLSRTEDASQLSTFELSSHLASDEDAQPGLMVADDKDNRQDETNLANPELQVSSGLLRLDKDPPILPVSNVSANNGATEGVAGTSNRAQTCEVKVSLLQPTKYSMQPTKDIGYLANRRGAPSLHRSYSLPKAGISAAPFTDATSARLLKKSSSFIRLSMTGDGNAKVVTKDSSSPSPPRPFQCSQPPGAKGQSITQPFGNLRQAPPNIAAVKPLQRSASGRSRDSRSWEFWCDKDTRGELEEKAEKSASGSAADAIGLLRSASGRSILGAIPLKRNSVLSKQSTSSKRSKLELPRSMLQKSSTSFARLQEKPAIHDSAYARPSPKLKQIDSGVSILIPGNESDKENWSPNTDVSSGRNYDNTGKHQISVQTPIVPEKQSLEHLKRGAVGKAGKPREFSSNLENVDPEADPELAAFMQGAYKSKSVSEEDDLDCVQGLLSLSQGNWR